METRMGATLNVLLLADLFLPIVLLLEPLSTESSDKFAISPCSSFHRSFFVLLP